MGHFEDLYKEAQKKNYTPRNNNFSVNNYNTSNLINPQANNANLINNQAQINNQVQANSQAQINNQAQANSHAQINNQVQANNQLQANDNDLLSYLKAARIQKRTILSSMVTVTFDADI